MIGIVLYSLIAIGLAAAAGYAVMSFFEASQTTTLAQENMARLETVAASVRANLRAVKLDGIALPPMGNTPAGDYTGVPNWIGVPDRSPWNVRYAYCPYAPFDYDATPGDPLDTTGQVCMTGACAVAQKYNVNIRTMEGGRAYVTAGKPPVDGVVAFIISAAQKATAMPRCDQVVADGRGGYTVPGGSVKAITTGIAYTQRVFSSSSKVTMYAAAAGTGQGSSPDDPTTLDAAMSIWQSVRPRVMDIVLKAGDSFTLDAGTLAPAGMTGEDGLTLVLRDDTADRADTAVTLSGVAAGSIPARLFIRNITLAAPVGLALTIQQNALVVQDAIMPPVVVNGGDMQVSGMVDFVSLAGVALDIKGATLFVPSDSVLTASVPSGATAVFLRSGTLRLEGEMDIVGSTGAPAVGISLGGTLDMPSGAKLFYTSNPPNVGIRMADGGTLKLDSGAQAGSGTGEPVVGVQDVGGLSVFGEGAVNALADCWSGRLFDASEDGIPGMGERSEPQTVVEPGDWPEVPDYVKYQALSTVNHSNWTCN